MGGSSMERFGITFLLLKSFMLSAIHKRILETSTNWIVCASLIFQIEVRIWSSSSSQQWWVEAQLATSVSSFIYDRRLDPCPYLTCASFPLLSHEIFTCTHIPVLQILLSSPPVSARPSEAEVYSPAGGGEEEREGEETQGVCGNAGCLLQQGKQPLN